MGLLYKLCWLAIPMYYFRKLPIIGRVFRLFLPISGHPVGSWRQLDTFDWYAPKYQHKHKWLEVGEWFAEAGLIDVKANKAEISVRGKKKC